MKFDIKKTHRIVLICSLCLFFLIINIDNAQAANVSAPGSVTTGSTFSVSVSVGGSRLFAASGTITYSGNITSGTASGSTFLIECSDADMQAGGASSLSTSFSFTAGAVGSGSVSISINSLINMDGAELGGSSGSATISITSGGGGGGGTASPTPRPTARPTVAPTPTVPVPDREIPVEIDGADLFIWHKIPASVEIPKGFEKDTIKIGEADVEAAVHEVKDLKLLYITDEEGENEDFYVYIEDGETPLVFPYIPINADNSFLVFPIPDDLQLPPGNFERVLLEIGELELRAWQDPDGEEYLYLLYVSFMDSTPGFYLYDSEQGTLQRYSVRYIEVEITPEPTIAPTPEPTVPAEPETEEPPTEQTEVSGLLENLNLQLFGIIIGGAVVLVVIISVIVIKKNA